GPCVMSFRHYSPTATWRNYQRSPDVSGMQHLMRISECLKVTGLRSAISRCCRDRRFEQLTVDIQTRIAAARRGAHGPNPVAVLLVQIKLRQARVAHLFAVWQEKRRAAIDLDDLPTPPRLLDNLLL